MKRGVQWSSSWLLEMILKSVSVKIERQGVCLICPILQVYI